MHIQSNSLTNIKSDIAIKNKQWCNISISYGQIVWVILVQVKQNSFYTLSIFNLFKSNQIVHLE